MGDPAAAPAPRRRVSRGLLGALVAFLFLPFPPVFLLGPLAGMLLLGRPGSFREWAWIAATVALAAAWTTAAPASVAQTVVLAGAAVFTGAFLAQIVWRGGPALRRAAAAAGFAMAVVAAACVVRGVTWTTLNAAMRSQLDQALTAVLDLSALTGEQAAGLRASVDAIAVLFPGLAILAALAGGTVAAAVAANVSRRPLVGPPGPFSAFRFNDHLIWGALATFGLFLVPHPEAWNPFLWNAMVLWGGLYLARGAATWLAVLRSWPTGPRIALFIGAILLLPYALGALVLLGLADTWIDIRRTARPSTTEGAD